MRASQASGSEVFRGMSVEGPPVRLNRSSADARSAAALAVQPELLIEAREQAAADGIRQGREEGLRSGYEEGLRRGHAEASEQMAQLLQDQHEAVERLAQARGRLAVVADALRTTATDWLAAAEDEMVCLCFEAICKLGGDCATRPDAVRQQLLHLRQRAGSPIDVELHVHPQDFAAIVGAQGEASMAAGFPPGTNWVADAAIATGGCMVHRVGGGLDLRLEAILADWLRALVEARAQRGRLSVAAPTNPEATP